MTTLYRKYRPQTFSDIVGQDHITAALQAAVAKQRVAHAYLFHGARGTGKTTTARVLARALGAKDIDVIEIDAASNRGIDDIRTLREGVNLSPMRGSYKIYIIDEVHMLTKEAFSALLKTLEEPVKHAVFILATTELHKVPETILSRCQVYRFRRAGNEDMSRRLKTILEQEKREIADNALQFIISRSDGCYRDAESLLGQVLTAQEGVVQRADIEDFLGLPPQQLLEHFLDALISGNASLALQTLEEVYTTGIDMDQFASEAILQARDILVAAIKENEADALGRWPAIIRALLQANQDLAYVPEPKIALQLAAVSVAKLKPAPAPSPHQGEGGNQASKLKKIWPQLIINVKAKNPVAATFLRAIEPMGWVNDIATAFGGAPPKAVVAVRVQYALHRNFFEKAGNKKLVEEELSKLLESKITVRFQLEEATFAQTGTAKQEEELYNTVKEVFAPR